MYPADSHATPPLPALVLALLLLGALLAGGFQAVRLLHMAPGTLAPTEALATPQRARVVGAPRPVALAPSNLGPGWETLTTAQKLVLYPLAERWSMLGAEQKRRWLTLAQNFPNMPVEEQSKLHSRMIEWASLSAQQRSQARLNYAQTNSLAPTDKRAQWEAYQALSEEQKKALAATAAPKPKGAATALRPVPKRKLVQVPAAIRSDGALQANPPKIPRSASQGPRIALPAVPATIQTPAHEAPPLPAIVETSPVLVPSAAPVELPPLPPLDTTSSAPAPVQEKLPSPFLQ